MKRTDSSLRARQALTVLAFTLAGCEQLPTERQVTERRIEVVVYHGREHTMNERWANHRYSELVAAMGTPSMIMNIPGGGQPPGFAVVFGRDPASGCIDAFAMMYAKDPIIRQYHCR